MFLVKGSFIVVTVLTLGFFDRNGIFVSNNKRKGDLFYVPCYFGNGMILFSCIILQYRYLLDGAFYIWEGS